MPYPLHPHGCPNYGVKQSCPPKVDLFHNLLSPPFNIIAVKFNLQEHIEKMKRKHPEWSERQLKCVLYWQGKVDAQLRKICSKLVSQLGHHYRILYSPEATGVDLFATMGLLGIRLERNPLTFVYKIAIIGRRAK